MHVHCKGKTMNKRILICDPTLRDGNHAVKHQLTLQNFSDYCKAAEAANVPVIEVGHGNGLGASSLLIGECLHTDEQIISTARQAVIKAKLAIHAIPGICTVKNHFAKAIGCGMDIFRVGAHCTEADVTKRHIEYVRNQDKEAFGVLMMSHMCPTTVLVEQAKKMESYGAQAFVIMDSAGNMLPQDVTEKTRALLDELSIPVGFHGHNNLGFGVANAVAAVEAGATIVDGSIRGFGGGAGNTQLEVLVAVLHRLGYETGIDLYRILDAASLAEKTFNPVAPYISPTSVISGLSGVVSVFSKQVAAAAEKYNIDARDIFVELGKRKAVAGQESLIIEIALNLSETKRKS
jgi:4-hydroxy 2-oxovalerate aldolase